MGTTVNRALPYPTAGDPDNVPYDMQRLADAVDDELGPAVDWTGLSGQATYSSGTANGSVTPRIRRAGDTVELRGWVSITSIAVGGSATIMQLSAPWRPAADVWLPFVVPAIANRVALIHIYTNGDVEVRNAQMSGGTIQLVGLDALRYYLG